jgi:hypothetical protein
VLRYGGFYGPGTSLAPGSEQVELAHPSWRQGFAELSGARAPQRPEFAAAA